MAKSTPRARTTTPTSGAKDVQLNQTTGKLESLQLLGEIITFGSRSGTTHKHVDVVSALKVAGLDEKVAREFTPPKAFSRAARKLGDAGVIDVVSEYGSEITFQFTKKCFEGRDESEGWKYVKDCYLTLDKSTGKISCKNTDLEVKAQGLLDQAMEERNTSDVTAIVMSLFDSHADLLPIPGAVGVFFVPQEHSDFVRKVEVFLGTLGRRPYSFPVPAGAGNADVSIQQTVGEAMQGLVDSHLEAINSFSLKTRENTLADQADKISATRVKIEAYAHYLNETRQELLDNLEAASTVLSAKVARLASDRPQDNGSKDRVKLLGHSPTSVLRWMGKQRWSEADARKVLVAEGIVLSDITIKTSLMNGARGINGDPADLSVDDVTKLESYRV